MFPYCCFFFQQKRKKTLSPILTLHCEKDASYSQNDLPTNETQDPNYHTEDPKSNVYESVSNCIKSIVEQSTGYAKGLRPQIKGINKQFYTVDCIHRT